MPRGLVAVTVLAAAASLALLWTDVVPLGVAGQWTWGRLYYSAPALVWGGLVSGLAGLVYAAIAWWGERRLASASRVAAAGWLGVLVIAGFAWLQAVQSVSIEGLGLGKAPYVLYYRRTEGYFWQARYDVRSVPQFLAGYEDLLAERDYLHIGTHPPGLTLWHYGLLTLCRGSPALVQRLERTEPEDVANALAQIQSQSRGGPHEVTRSDAAALWLAALLTQAAAALTAVPLYLYLRLSAPREAAWRAAAFWPLVPALAVFLPKSDLLYPVIGMTAAWLWRRAWLRAQLRIGAASVAGWLLAGLVVWTGMLLSPAFVTVMTLIAVQATCDALADDAHRSRAAWLVHWTTAAVCGSGCVLLALGAVLVLFGSQELNLLNVWRWNFENHALFYEHNVRTRQLWLLVNPVELTLAAGVPIVATAAWGALRQQHQRRGLLRSPVVPFTVVWALLWLSGKNMGEGARLWILLLPWLAGATVNAWPAGGSSPTGARRLWLTLLALQLAVAAATTLRIDGFHFTELLRP